jgi:hypothetical protein
MLADELAAQRTFLSAEEEASLTLPAAHDDEDNLAWQRVRGRRSWFFPVLRDRFIRDGRQQAAWRALIAQEEVEAGGQPTFITQLATQVLEWAARTSDRGAMMVGFAARALRIVGMLLLVLGGWSYLNGAPTGGTIVGAFGLLLVLVSVAAARVAARRVNWLLRSAPTQRPAGT